MNVKKRSFVLYPKPHTKSEVPKTSSKARSFLNFPLGKIKILIGLLVMIILIGGCAEKPITGVEWFQTGNTQDITKLQTKRSQELEDNHIGAGLGTYYREDAPVNTPYKLDSYGDNPELVYSLGFKWMRISHDDWVGDVLDWPNVEVEPGKYLIDPKRGITSDDKYSGKTYPASHPSVDEVISGYASNNITIVLSLNVGNEENHQAVSRFRDSDELERYSNYVRFMVNHFKDRIEYYEIWNEPRGDQMEDYISLVKHVIPIIREEYPEAKIVIGALSGDWASEGQWNASYSLDADYIKGFLGPDLAPMIDAISWHPFYYTMPDNAYYQNYPQMVEDIKEFAASNGFKGEYLADEISWKTYQTEEETEGFVSEKIAGKYYARAIIMHRGINLTVSILLRASSLLDILPNLGTVMAGNKPIDLPIEIQSEATNIRYYTFSVSNGDKLIALWTDGVAVDDDPGVNADLTFDGFSGKEVIGIDVLNGYQQSIVVYGNKIENLIVRDYPLVLRIKRQ